MTRTRSMMTGRSHPAFRPAGRRPGGSPFAPLRRHRVAIASTVVVAAVAATLVTLAYASHGYPARHVDLNDGGIWVTSDKDGLFGQLDKPAGALSQLFNPPGGAQSAYQLDIRQDGAAVVAWDQASGRLYPVDVAGDTVIADQGIAVASGEQVALGGGTLAVLDPRSNRVWAMRVDTSAGVASISQVAPEAKPVAHFTTSAIVAGAPHGASLAVGTDGTVYAADVAGQIATSRADSTGRWTTRYAQLGQPLQSVQVSAVGSRLVVLDAKAGNVMLPGGSALTIPAGSLSVIQQPSPSGSAVIVATATQLLSISLSTGAKEPLFDGGSGAAPAQPTWLGPCLYAAWAGTPGVYASACTGGAARQQKLAEDTQLINPVFRVNRNSILLNDLVTGQVYDLDTQQQVADWSAARPPPVSRTSRKSKNNNTSASARNLPPKANNVTLGARPGRTTILHLLDYDSDPQGYVLAISAVTPPDEATAGLSISPDGQSVEIAMPPSGGDVHFRYTINDGKGLTARAAVTVHVRTQAQNELPALRRGFVQRGFSVSAGGNLSLPVIGDWRDYDGDPVVLATASTKSGTVSTTPQGDIEYVAPAAAGQQAITYDVSDGVGHPVQHTIPITVLDPSAGKSVAPTAEPDTARGETGKPITITPLANDLPGVDGSNPSAALALAGSIASPAGATVDTDLKAGIVTVTASAHGTYLLSYTDSFGTAPYARGTIRVDVTDPPSSPPPPITVPTSAALYGQSPATVDVLAADFDPAGGVLVVQHAGSVLDNNQLQVAIVAGRFLRLTALTPQLAPSIQIVDYTVTDGLSAPVTGQVTVTQVPSSADEAPLTVPDYATVRTGDSASIPVLDNDIDRDGAQLSLVADVQGAPAPGRLTVVATSGPSTDVGTAFVSGTRVRYLAPAGVTTQRSVQITYVAQNPSGQQTAGTAFVTITPPPSRMDPDAAPVPQDLTARLVAGDAVDINIPTTGIDPDGDTATVTGIVSAPRLGRILSVGPTSIQYEAFPTSSGPDTFSYTVADRYGLTGTASVALGVVGPGQTQPPVAVDESVAAAPNNTLRVDVLSNAVIAPDDIVTITPLAKADPELPAGVTLAGASGPIVVDTGPASSRPIVLTYSITDGLAAPSIATLTVHVIKGYVSPPNAQDVVAAPKANATTVTVPVLSHDSDPENSPLHIASSARFTVSSTSPGSVTVPVLDHVQNIPYVIADALGGTAAAVIHVPATGSGGPYPVPNQLITIPKNGSRTIHIGDYVRDPLGRALRLTTTNELATAPSTGLRLTSPSTTTLTLTGVNNYVGPAAITFQVTDGTSLDDPRGQLAVITVPVQVGPDTPVLRCPQDPIPVVEGGVSRTIDVAVVCHVWAPEAGARTSLTYTASWSTQPGGLEVSGAGSRLLTVTATGSAKPGERGTLSIGVTGTAALHSSLQFTVVGVGPPTVAPIVIDGFTAGQTATRNITGFVTSMLRDPIVSVVSLRQTSGLGATVSHRGANVSITPGRSSHGMMTFALVVTDVPDTSNRLRWADGSITMNVLNVPDAPSTPIPGRTQLSRVVQLSWTAPADNGALIDSYQVRWSGGSQTCAASPCSIGNLTNGVAYRFAVRAHNAVGYSRWSANSAPATPDALPGAARNLTTSDPQDGSLLVSWRAAPDPGSAIKYYTVTWSGGHSAQVTGLSIRATGLNNDFLSTFNVTATNAKGPGPRATVTGQSAGKPSPPAGLAVHYADSAGSTQRTVTVSWDATDPNGPGPTHYTVTRDGAQICPVTTATSCNDTPNTGATYTYAVTAANTDNHVSLASTTRFEVAGQPDTVVNIKGTNTAVDGQLSVTYTVPNSHGSTSTITCTYNGGTACPGSPQFTPNAAPGAQGSVTLSGLPNDADVTVTLVDCNDQQLCGTPASSNTAHTDGPPNPPTGLGCSLSGDTITWAWGRGAEINGYATTFTLNGADSASGYTGTSWAKTYPEDGNTHSLTVTAVDSRGERSSSPSQACQDHTNPPPQQSVQVYMGTYSTSLAGCSSGCHYVNVRLKNFAPNHKYVVSAVAGHPYAGADGTITMTTDGSGNFDGRGGPWYGYPDFVTVTVNGISGTCSGNWGSPTGSCS